MSGWKKLAAAGAAGGIPPWDISSASLVSNKDVTADGIANPSGLWVKPDGSKIYVLDDGAGNDIHEYNMSTNFTVSTASLSQKKSVAFSDPTWGFAGAPSDMWINEDGTKLFVMDQGNYRLYPWTFSTAWDVSTLSWDNKRAVVSSGNPLGIDFNPDGSSFYVVYDSSSYGVEQYDMTTAFDVSTASFSQRDSASIGTAHSIRFHPEGKQMFLLLSNELVAEYALSTAWDVSTASFVQNSPTGVFSGRDTSGQGLAFSADGAYMYFIGEANERIDQAAL